MPGLVAAASRGVGAAGASGRASQWSPKAATKLAHWEFKKFLEFYIFCFKKMIFAWLVLLSIIFMAFHVENHKF